MVVLPVFGCLYPDSFISPTPSLRGFVLLMVPAPPLCRLWPAPLLGPPGCGSGGRCLAFPPHLRACCSGPVLPLCQLLAPLPNVRPSARRPCPAPGLICFPAWVAARSAWKWSPAGRPCSPPPSSYHGKCWQNGLPPCRTSNMSWACFQSYLSPSPSSHSCIFPSSCHCSWVSTSPCFFPWSSEMSPQQCCASCPPS